MQTRIFLLPALTGMLLAFTALAQAPATGPTTATQSAQKKSAEATTPPSAADIANARSKGLVWVNTSTKVYHKPDGASYGTTKRGKFMTEDDAVKAGYRAAKEPVASKKKPSAQTPAPK